MCLPTTSAAILTRKSVSTWTAISLKCTGRSANASTVWTGRRICRASWNARSTCPSPAGPVLVDVPMDIFSADLPVDAFQKFPALVARPAMDPAAVAQIVQALAEARHPVIYAGGGVLSAHATTELAALAEALEVPVAHTLM